VVGDPVLFNYDDSLMATVAEECGHAIDVIGECHRHRVVLPGRR
jgi:hypothetical protein